MLFIRLKIFRDYQQIWIKTLYTLFASIASSLCLLSLTYAQAINEEEAIIELKSYITYSDNTFGQSATPNTYSVESDIHRLRLNNIYHVEIEGDQHLTVLSGSNLPYSKIIYNNGNIATRVYLKITQKHNAMIQSWSEKNYVEQFLLFEETNSNSTPENLLLFDSAAPNDLSNDQTIIVGIDLAPQQQKKLWFSVVSKPRFANTENIVITTQGAIYESGGIYTSDEAQKKTNIIDLSDGNGQDALSDTSQDFIQILPNIDTIDIYFQERNLPIPSQNLANNEQEYDRNIHLANGYQDVKQAYWVEANSEYYYADLIVENDKRSQVTLKFESFLDENLSKSPLLENWDISYQILRPNETERETETNFRLTIPAYDSANSQNSQYLVRVHLTPPTRAFQPSPITTTSLPQYLDLDKPGDGIIEQGIFFRASNVSDTNIKDTVLIAFEPAPDEHLTFSPETTKFYTLKDQPNFASVPYVIKNEGNIQTTFIIRTTTDFIDHSENWEYDIKSGAYDYRDIVREDDYPVYFNNGQSMGIRTSIDKKIHLFPNESLRFDASMIAKPSGPENSIQVGNHRIETIRLNRELSGENPILTKSVTYKIVKPEMQVSLSVYRDQNCDGQIHSINDTQLDETTLLEQESGNCAIFVSRIENTTDHHAFLPQNASLSVMLPEKADYLAQSLYYYECEGSTIPTCFSSPRTGSDIGSYLTADHKLTFNLSNILGISDTLPIQKGLTIFTSYAVKFN